MSSALAQDWTWAIAGNCAKVDSVYEYLEEFESLGTKVIGSPEIANTRDWLSQKYSGFGYADISFDTFQFAGHQCENVIVEKPGLLANEWIILTAHYDTKNGPGVNDNGTGVVACLQIAKILASIETQRGIRIVHFSAEENGLIGSEHYVTNSIDTNDIIHLVFNLDQLGGSVGRDNSKIVCERDEDNGPATNNAASYAATDTLADLFRLYTFITPVISNAYGSDYVPFENAGYVITGLYQESDDRYNHSSSDLLSNVDTDATTKVIKGALAATMHFAKHTLPTATDELDELKVNVYPNPANDVVTFANPHAQDLFVEISTAIGSVVIEQALPSRGEVSVSNLPAGLYTVNISDKSQGLNYSSKLIIAR